MMKMRCANCPECSAIFCLDWLSQEIWENLPDEAGILWVGAHWRSLLAGGAVQEGGHLPSEAGDQTLESIQRPERRGVRIPHSVSIGTLVSPWLRLKGRVACLFVFTSHWWEPKLWFPQGGERLAEGEERVSAEAHETDRGGQTRSQNQPGMEFETP